jgi:hypothetical protein
MRTIAGTAVGSAMGLAVVAAMFLTIWVARDTSARADATAGDTNAASSELWSARTHRSPVTRTSITPEQLRQLRGR